MNPKNPQTPESAPRKRFRLEKIEERIAPSVAGSSGGYFGGGHWNPHSKLVGTGGSGSY